METIISHINKPVRFAYEQARGRTFWDYYRRFLREDSEGVAPETTNQLLINLLTHCQKAVPYYADIMQQIGTDFRADPQAYLTHLPILTKAIIRNQATQLTSTDLHQRKWMSNSSGGSTGEPSRFIQDTDFNDRSRAITALFARWLGKEVGDLEIALWGSERDIFAGHASVVSYLKNRMLYNKLFLNAYHMSPEKIRGFVQTLNTKKPALIVAYGQALYEVARFVAQEGIAVVPQRAIISTANTLYPFMRETIEQVFGCSVYNRYGSREIGSVACQVSPDSGLYVAPWGAYLEIVDDAGKPVPPGTEGNILATTLGNFAMPLVRYAIGDRGILSSSNRIGHRYGQVLAQVLGRNEDTIRKEDGTMVDGGIFTELLCHKEWVWRFQLVQKSYTHLLYRIATANDQYQQAELDEIVSKTKQVMGRACEVTFEFLDDIQTSPSGKFRYTISEVDP